MVEEAKDIKEPKDTVADLTKDLSNARLGLAGCEEALRKAMKVEDMEEVTMLAADRKTRIDFVAKLEAAKAQAMRERFKAEIETFNAAALEALKGFLSQLGKKGEQSWHQRAAALLEKVPGLVLSYGIHIGPATPAPKAQGTGTGGGKRGSYAGLGITAHQYVQAHGTPEQKLLVGDGKDNSVTWRVAEQVRKALAKT